MTSLALFRSQRLHQLGALVALATLDLGELANQRPGAAVEIVLHGFALGVEAQAALALLVGADSEVGDELAPMRFADHPPPPPGPAMISVTYERFLSDVTPLELQSPQFQ